MHRPHGARRGLRALVTTTVLALGLSVGATSGVAHAAAKAPSPAQLGASWMADQITANGGYLKSFGVADVPDTAYAVVGLHAAKTGQAASAAAINYLHTQLGSALQLGGTDAPGPLSYFIMAAVASGDDPRHFGGTGATNDLVGRLLAIQHTSGPDAGLFGAQDPTYDGAFRQGLALAAMKAAKVKAKDAHVVSGINWLSKQQCANGLWQSYRSDTATPCPPADPDFFTGPDTNSSSLAIQGLAAWGKKPNKAGALSALHAVQSSDGGFSFMAAPGQASDPNSTALAMQTLVTLGSSPKGKTWIAPGGGTPISALASYQLTCADGADARGAYFFPGSRTPNVFATVQSVPAAALKRLPVAKSAKIGDPVASCPSGAACTSATGVTVVVDMTAFGQGVKVGCADHAPATGLDALTQAGFTFAGTTNFGNAFVCRINGQPTAATQPCTSTPPANAFWSYYHASSSATTWSTSSLGASTYAPAAGSTDAWAFGANAKPSITPTAARAS